MQVGYVRLACIQVAAEKLDEEATQYDEDSLGPIVEAAKKTASMWLEMARLLRLEFHIVTIIH